MIAVRRADPRSPEGLRLLGASQALMAALYPPEHNHAMDTDALAGPDVTFLVAEEAGEALGCAALARREGYGEVKSMWTDPAARGRGVGAALLAALEAEARAQGLGMLRLETGDDLAEAHRLYARAGFVPCGPFGDYAEGPRSVFMERRL
jgi:putative acetyltransferase